MLLNAPLLVRRCLTSDDERIPSNYNQLNIYLFLKDRAKDAALRDLRFAREVN